MPILKESNYSILQNGALMGDAPKELIRAYFYQRGGAVLKSSPRTWVRFICKSGCKWYPNEVVTEYLLNRLAQQLIDNVNSVRLVKNNGQIRFLSAFFLKKGEGLVHGAEIIGQYLEDHHLADEIAHDRKTAIELFTYDLVCSAIKEVYPLYHSELLSELHNMIFVDALLGANDRHFYNWAVVVRPADAGFRPRFAPLYDTARGLFWNTSDGQLENWKRNGLLQGRIANYIEQAAPRIGVQGKKEVNHFDLIARVLQTESAVQAFEHIATEDNFSRTLYVLKDEFAGWMSPLRMTVILDILRQRWERTQQLLGK